MTGPNSSFRVIFFQVKTAAQKLACITETIQRHFESREKFLVVVEEDRALSFLDELLWKTPPSSFLPHSIISEEKEEWIAITKVKKNLNQARAAFNLCSTPLMIEGAFRILYEFEDFSSPNKKILSQMRFDAYKKANYFIESHRPVD